MPSNVLAARAAKDKAVHRVKRAIKELEQYIPPDQDQEELPVLVEPSARPERSVAVGCQQCAAEVQDLDADGKAAH